MSRRQRSTPSIKQESLGEFTEPSTRRRPETLSTREEDMETDSEQFCYVEVSLEDEDSDTLATVNETRINPPINGMEGAQGDPAEQITQEGASDERPVKRRRNKRSLIWRHYEQLDCLSAARCRICQKKLQYFEGGSTSNLHRHLSKRHPEMFSQLMTEGQHPPPQPPPPDSSKSSNANGHTATPPESVGPTKEQKPFSGNWKVPKVSEVEKRAFRRELELIEALRRAQREEARALEYQRDLLEKLRAVNAREAAAEREQIESLRKAQLEEAEDLSRQREEVQKEKTELQKKFDELQQEREELVLFSKGQQAS
ncbi:uncharacterized protein LOC141757906 [Sebastes fasciatus]|uniref:uncharacterized protein LOC141757906 n=1 Tax=Sebastes fasciatus TaxID=394691 RepID=UPI003D9E2797